MEFSVIIAVRNELQHIEQCIQSVFNQDYTKAYEVIVVDGMSTDKTYELLKKLQKKYDFQLLQNPVLNAAAGRNTGIKHSKGTYTAFIDGDAIAHKDWLSKIKKTFEENDVSGVGGPDLLPKNSTSRSKMIGQVMTSPVARGGKLNPSTQHSLMDEEKLVDHIPTCNLCLKKEVFEKAGMFDEKFVKGQDLELNYRIRKKGFKLLYSPNIRVIHHRKHHMKDFTRQIYKWAKAKVAIIKKHGMNGLVSHIYLWPVYFIVAMLIGFLMFYLIDKIFIFFFFGFFGILFYGTVITLESAQLARNYKNLRLFPFAICLFPLIHMSYACGVIAALLKRKIW